MLSGLALGACGSGGIGGTSIGGGSGSLTLGITDGPVDLADNVFVQFSGVEIQPESGDRLSFVFEDINGNPAPKTIDLLALQGGLRDTLLDGETLPTGNYDWIRLLVNAEGDDVYDSYIVIGGNQYELRVPSGSQTGLKLNTPFQIVEGGNDYTIDFDLRKSVHHPKGQKNPSGAPLYFLRPTLRLVETAATGTIAGVLDAATVFAGLTCSSPEEGYAVYVFAGTVTPDDVDGIDPDPVTTADVTVDGNGDYVYTAPYLLPGDYTVAATCQADLDDPEVDDAIEFVSTTPVTVSPGQTTIQDL